MKKMCKHKRFLAIAIVGFLFFTMDHSVTNAQSYQLTGEIVKPVSPTGGDQFGFSFKTTDDTLLVYARTDSLSGSTAGAAYLFDGALNPVHTFGNPTPSSGDHFGEGTLAGDSYQYVVLGDAGDDVGRQNAGSIHIYDRTTGVKLSTFSNPNPGSGFNFGRDVKPIPNTNTVLISEVQVGFGGSGPGRAHLFDLSTNTITTTINNPTPTNGDRFSWESEVSSTMLFLNATQDDTLGNNAGAIYAYDYSGNLQYTLTNPATIGGAFGSMAINESEGILFVGDAGVAVGGGTRVGEVYMFDMLTGTHLGTVANPDPDTDDVFGGDIFVDNNKLFVSTEKSYGGNIQAGSVLYFDVDYNNNSAALVQTILNPDPTPGDFDRFGAHIGMLNNQLLISSDVHDSGGANGQGKILIYDVVPEPMTISLLAIGSIITIRRKRKL